ncbi:MULTISPECIES: ATP synthase subunit I [unclassified Modicisalibacter]|uniref:ATP synthase subunit I n=1 Tax=unclassified Modicisalibacter TaxID=2679913 RepID=UPI001CCD1053|nr:MULTISPECIES: ATP synthase subunit I [unclassified Modicisalibacter]MBZ9558662.1 ATP synthase subunit I [Modicisalibacter sp. R2A 31.J]MBZ9575446.1 ATP synthase subunit I [Modicisalibacter sp. MOD 31.J]
MPEPRPAQIKRPGFARLLAAQMLVLLIMVAIAAGTAGVAAAVSALLGALIGVVPNAYFAWRAFRYQGARHARDIVKSFYRAEAGKFGLTAALFTLVFIAVPPSNPAFFFGAYVATLATQWLGPWLLRRASYT